MKICFNYNDKKENNISIQGKQLIRTADLKERGNFAQPLPSTPGDIWQRTVYRSKELPSPKCQNPKGTKAVH
jgi:hypothetical protein